MTRPFSRFAAIDWSGAKGEFQRGIAVAICEAGDAAPVLVQPQDKAWSRPAILDWLLDQQGSSTLIGLDLSPAFPFEDRGAYFPGWPQSPADAKALWALVDSLSDDPHFATDGFLSSEARHHFRQHRDLGRQFQAGRGRLRACEVRQLDMRLSPSSCFNLVGAAQVGKSSLTGMRVMHRLGGRIPIWPFDPVPASGPLIVEIYTTIAARAGGLPPGRSKMRDAASLNDALARLGTREHLPLASYDDHATDAMLTAAWLRHAASDEKLWRPKGLDPHLAQTEGWTFGVP